MSLNYNNLLVIHIPRTGTHCIPWKQFPNMDDENPVITSHRDVKVMKQGRFDTFLELSSKFDTSEFSKITMVRNPFTRTYSLYNRYIELCKLYKSERTFFSFLDAIKHNKPLNPIARNMLGKTQTSFLTNSSNEIDQSIEIFKLEQIDSLRSFLQVEFLPQTNRRKYNSEQEYAEAPEEVKVFVEALKQQGRTYSTTEMQQAYDQSCVNLVLELYPEDFDNFGYSRSFEDCLI